MNSPSILVVEDSQIQSEILRRLLVGQGYECQLAANGEEGLQFLGLKNIDLVISDIQMPVMDGYQMCERIKNNPELHQIPVILLTALSDPVDVIRGLNAGAEAYLTKPYDNERLLKQVALLLKAPLPPLDPEPKEPIGIQIEGENYEVHANRRQILHMLVSTYDNAAQQNRVLRKMEEELRLFNQKLELRVIERTSALSLQEIKASEAELRYRTLFSLLPEGVVLMSPDSLEFIESNEVACTQLGYSQAEFLALTLQSITAPASLQTLMEDIQQARLREEYSFSTTQLTKSGKSRDVEIRTRMIELGEQHFFHCIFRDVTDINRTHALEEELKKNATLISELNREIQAIDTLSKHPTGVGELSEDFINTLLESMIERYTKLLDQAVERQAYQIQVDLSESLQKIAQELGAAGSGPREVVALHGKALRIKIAGMKAELKWAYMEEGRLMVLELMGYLADYYRKVTQ